MFGDRTAASVTCTLTWGSCICTNLQYTHVCVDVCTYIICILFYPKYGSRVCPPNPTLPTKVVPINLMPRWTGCWNTSKSLTEVQMVQMVSSVARTVSKKSRKRLGCFSVLLCRVRSDTMCHGTATACWVLVLVLGCWCSGAGGLELKHTIQDP